ncbi:hypothetical protein K458DRAFT_434114 [Lentithecium fluviatile CBS 122367]|uniref:Heterokaryon incompatibility domain-containing protein n=1 Tax=Lentithecium fluviatile CBS 122367 TaxID=1168545 RepID=A0A6G1IS96_9PLEO|nr:hypothetical protein K458DRAFT_434114 [Lentithecium fluviatile CBS 122367]
MQMWLFNAPELGPVSDGFYDSHALRLGAYEIRVLRLQRGSGQDDIICTLEKRLLPPTTAAAVGTTERKGERSQPADLDCTALSYQWGDPKKNLRRIQCDGVGFVVTWNLYSALVHLCSSDTDITLWIDAICIDQRNDGEKGSQVGRMGDIYLRAKRTVIWLGDGGFLVQEAFRTCSMMRARHTSRGNLPAPSPLAWLWDAWGIVSPFLVLLLLKRPYFTRIWIIQEVALSNSIEIACGSSRISWSDFTIGTATILASGVGSKSAAGLGNVLVARSLLPWASRGGMDDPAWIYRTLMKKGLPQAKNILAMATLFRRSHATNPVDKLFGLLGLCEEIQQGSTYGILATYSRDNPSHSDRVYIDTARTILHSQNSLQLFSAVNHRPPNKYGFLIGLCRRIRFGKIQPRTLPMWVPDWSDTGSVATPLSLMLAQDNTSSTEDGAEHHSSPTLPRPVSNRIAETNTEVDTYSLREMVVFDPSNAHRYSPHIWLSGCCIDEIVELGEVCNTEKAQSSIWFNIRFFFTMSESHRFEIFSKWERQFRAVTQNGSFWGHFISTITCGPSNTYNEGSVMRALNAFRSRSPRNLPFIPKAVFATLFILPLAVGAWERSSIYGILERIVIYWCFPVVAVSSMWYLCFQLTPNFIFKQDWGIHGVGEGFLKAEFENMELRRMARLRSEALALVPEASCIGDQIWSCRGGIVPLVLRPHGEDFEMVDLSARLKRLFESISQYLKRTALTMLPIP